MRVEVVESLIKNDAVSAKFTDPAVERALKNFLAALSSDDSLFVGESSAATIDGDPQNGTKTCRATLALEFRDDKQASSRHLHFSLLQKLSELLKTAGSADSLSATLCLVPGSSDSKNRLALWIGLEASGNSSEQAGLRWGLGLAHVQQALLFLSRYLRQQIAQSGD
jgi:hypothetical protein